MKFFLSFMFLWASADALIAASQKYRITGLASDVHSGATLADVSFYTLDENRRVLLSSTDAKGFFSFGLDTDNARLVIEKKGYRTIQTSVASYRNASRKTDFFIKIPLIPLDAQAKDAPYMQSEQKEYKLPEEQKKKFSVVRTFVITDALNGAAVRSGTLCFDFTKDGRRECKELANDPVMSFTEADIVGFTVTAPGYQSYTGNLLLEKMDAKPGKYHLQLAPEITMLSLNVTGNVSVANCRLISDTGADQLIAPAAKEAYVALAREGNYSLRVYNNAKGMLYSEKITIAKGLNLMGIAIKSNARVVPDPGATTPAPVAEALPQTQVRFDTLQPVTIYFLQSNYKYTDEERAKLDALASWLRSNPDKKVRLVGHTDNVGDPRLNITLSENRAKVIRHYLISKKVMENQLIWIGVGGKYPAQKNDNEESKRMNRRVEITFIQ